MSTTDITPGSIKFGKASYVADVDTITGTLIGASAVTTSSGTGTFTFVEQTKDSAGVVLATKTITAPSAPITSSTPSPVTIQSGTFTNAAGVVTPVTVGADGVTFSVLPPK